MNLLNTITPKSDQLNADDLIAGPRTIKITAVEPGSAEQPVSIRFEGDNGRPYKPGKSMRRALFAMWGSDGAVYVGRRLSLYCDKTITFGPDTTGGIRISHASHISEPLEIALTVKRGKRKPFRVDPLPTVKEPAIDLSALVDVGETKAREGIESLRTWWESIPAAAKTALKPKLDSEWKRIADEKTAATKGNA
jgi:hypothetical protein